MSARNTRIFLNGRFVSEQEATVSVFDRCFLYGDGIFEGIAVWERAPFRLQPHLDRMKDGLDYLRIPNPYDDEGWTGLIEQAMHMRGQPLAPSRRMRGRHDHAAEIQQQRPGWHELAPRTFRHLQVSISSRRKKWDGAEGEGLRP